MAKSMLFEKGFPRGPTKVVWNKTPFEAWSARTPSMDHLKVFGCIFYTQIPKQKRTKMEEKM